jgi:hypothetical protein
MSARPPFLIILLAAMYPGVGSPELVAQAPSADRFWLSGGVGAGTVGEAGVSFAVDLAYQRGAHLLAVRGTAVLAGYEISDSAGEIGFVYGRASTGPVAGHRAATIGLSLVELDLPGIGLRHAIGLPVAAEASINAPIVGLGLRAFASLNSVQSFAGLIVILKLGRLR